ncbi:hypothetical protein NDU88_000072 [Pleurodeles waltl]|uniref:Uncharacterized protein n=1 Tax=Pleurodeles waltl TaxID=8319 RepID=A0AAV7S745_PLEWA|nr:hypothetical protein NDU88_000072 [Pleurodeles waltl]
MLGESGLTTWEEVGVETMGALFQESTFLTYEHLQEASGLPAGHFLAHAHLLAEALRLWGITDREPVQLLLMMGKGHKLITWLARVFVHAAQDPLAAIHREWERDLGKEFTIKEWETVLEYPRRVLRNAKFQYIQYNILHRAFLTTDIFFRMYGSSSAFP